MATLTRFTVDAAHCDRAEASIFAILLAQDRAFQERWRNSPRRQRFAQIVRSVGFIFATGCVGFTTGYLLDAPSLTQLMIVLYFVAGAVFIACFPAIERSFEPRLGRFRTNSCRANARKTLEIARRYAPFDAEFRLDGSVLTYTRHKDGVQHPGWQRDLSKYHAPAVGIVAADVAVILRRRGAFVATVAILHDGSGWVRQALQGAGIELRESAALSTTIGA